MQRRNGAGPANPETPENRGDIPIEQATRFVTIVNLEIAKALGLDMAATRLAAANELIE